MKYILLVFLTMLLVAPAPASAELRGDGQVRADNLLLWQNGRDPRNDADTVVKLYDQFNLPYDQGAFRAGLRFESYRISTPPPPFGAADYDEITRRWAEWSTKGLRLQVGNTYATLGRGLLFRAFELPGVVRTASFPRSKYVDSRDLEGFVIEANRGPLSVSLLSGTPTRYPDNPFGAADEFIPRREGSVSGGRAALEIGDNLVLGGAYLRTEAVASPGLEDLGSLDIDVNAGRLIAPLREADMDLRFYGEFAGRSWDPLDDGFDTGEGLPRARYTATELGRGRWALSYETKDYRDFRLGVNDPPSVVPEMRQHLLNRMSHFLLSDNESGHQLSVMGALAGDWTLELESARALNKTVLWDNHYELDYISLASPFLSERRVEIFLAEGRDEIETISRHRTFGAGFSADLDALTSLEISVEHQRADRRLLDETFAFENTFVVVALSKAGLGTLALQAEYSNDRTEKDISFTPETETEPRSWIGLALGAPVGLAHELSIFAGERRGGTACTSGTCYLVPEFSGVEMRISSRF